jgi:8-oxo-dGTP pyrophosphatase MutT (NUDIX family)
VRHDVGVASDLSAEWWTTSDVAEYLGVVLGTVSSYRRRGQMPAPDKTLGRTRLWRPATIVDWHSGRPRVGERSTGSAAPLPARQPAEDDTRWRVHGERAVYSSEWIQVGLADVEFPDGGRTEHHIVRMRPAAIAAVLDDSGERALFMWRHRFVPDLWNWELPGGFVEDGEDPAVAASREVEEETGWRPRNLEHLVTFEPMIGMITTPHHVYLARGAERVGDPTEVNEMQQLRWIPLTDVPHLIANGKVCSSGALVALLHVLAISGPQARDETRFD